MREFPDAHFPYLREGAAFPYLHGCIIPEVAESLKLTTDGATFGGIME
jgi:hypothetical protein